MQFARRPAGRALLATVCEERGISDAALRSAFDLCDLHGFGVAGQFRPMVGHYRPVWGDDTRTIEDYELISGEIGNDGDLSQLDEAQARDVIDWLLQSAKSLAERKPRPKPAALPGWMIAHSAVREAGHGLRTPAAIIRAVIKLIPCDRGMSLTVATKRNRPLARLMREDKRVRGLIEVAETFESWFRKNGVDDDAQVGSPEAMRKRKARAEGRVKPRAKKPPRTLVDEVKSREKAVETRRAKFAAAEAALRDRGVLVGHAFRPFLDQATGDLYDQAVRTKVGLERAEKALATFRARLAATSQG